MVTQFFFSWLVNKLSFIPRQNQSMWKTPLCWDFTTACIISHLQITSFYCLGVRAYQLLTDRVLQTLATELFPPNLQNIIIPPLLKLVS